MSNSFLVCTDKKAKDLVINKFHINIWEINTRYIRLDCGLHFKISKKELLNLDEFAFYFFTPFPILRKSLTVLYQDLLNDRNINLIFNEKCLEIKECTNENSFSYANLIKLENGVRFLLIKPSIKEYEDTKIVFKIDQKHLNLSDFEKEVEFYIRFHYRVDLKKCKNNIISKFNLSTDFITYDIRLRELRLFDSNDLENIYDKIIGVEFFYVFIINEVRFKPRITVTENFRYVRILEKDLFKFYVKELSRTIKKYTIHFWKFKLNDKNDPANLVVSFEKEKGTRIIVSFALAMNIIVATIFTFSSKSFNVSDFNPVILFIILLLALVLFTPGLFRRIYNNLWISRANRKN